MNKRSIFLDVFIIITFSLFFSITYSQNNITWCAGTWNASLQSWHVHPRTVAIRLEVVDSRTLIGPGDVRVTLRGEYKEEHIELYVPSRIQIRQWELSALTNEEGVAVFALSWQKEYPWSSGQPKISDGRGGWTNAESWIRPVDDVEKVRVIEARHPRYYGINIPFNFDHLLQFGQDENSEPQNVEIVDRFDSAWKMERDKPNVRFCILSLGENFPDFRNSASTRPEFFKAIRLMECKSTAELNGDVGPYLVYFVRIELDPVRDR